jgi:hypothetical protein
MREPYGKEKRGRYGDDIHSHRIAVVGMLSPISQGGPIEAHATDSREGVFNHTSN